MLVKLEKHWRKNLWDFSFKEKNLIFFLNFLKLKISIPLIFCTFLSYT